MKYTHSVYFVGKTNARENGWYIGVAKIKSYIIFDGRDSHPKYGVGPIEVKSRIGKKSRVVHCA